MMSTVSAKCSGRTVSLNSARQLLLLSSVTNEETEEQSNMACRHCALSSDAMLSLRYQVKADKTKTKPAQSQVHFRARLLQMSRKSRKSALLNFLLPQSKILPFPFFTFKKREQNLHDRYFFFYKSSPTAGSGASSHLSQWCRSRSLSRCLSCSRFLSWK